MLVSLGKNEFVWKHTLCSSYTTTGTFLVKNNKQRKKQLLRDATVWNSGFDWKIQPKEWHGFVTWRFPSDTQNHQTEAAHESCRRVPNREQLLERGGEARGGERRPQLRLPRPARPQSTVQGPSSIIPTARTTPHHLQTHSRRNETSKGQSSRPA